MTTTSSAMTVSAHSGKAENDATWIIALTIAKKIADQRDQLCPANSPKAVSAMRIPTDRWIQPQVVKSAMMTPWPPTVTTSSLSRAARPHIELKKALTNSTIPAKVVHPVGMYSSRGTEVLEGVGAEVAIEPSFH